MIEIRTQGDEPTVVRVYEDWVTLCRCELDAPYIDHSTSAWDLCDHVENACDALAARDLTTHEVTL